MDKGGVMGQVERTVRDDVDQLGDLVGVEPSLAAVAVTLARQIDQAAAGECEECGAAVAGGEAGRLLPQLSRELRQTLAQMLEGRSADDDDDLGDLGTPE